MSEPKFTPGPWEAGKSIYQSQARVVAEKGGRIADVFAYEEDQARANAALIAAAPELCRDLHEAVIEMCTYCPSGEATGGEICDSSSDCFVKKWRMTLKKARGEA